VAACDEQPNFPLAPEEEQASVSFGKGGNGGGGPEEDRILVFSDKEDPSGDIYSMNPDGTGLTRITNTPGPDYSATWSPDGKRIAFVSTRHDPRGDIYVMNGDGTGVTRLTNRPGADYLPTWSKDGKRIGFASARDAVDPAAPTNADVEIYVMNADGTNAVRLTHNALYDAWPAWSPDGRKIMFISNRDHVDPASDVYTMNPDGSGITRLTFEGKTVGSPEWSPDGRRIALWASDGIYTMRLDGTAPTLLVGGVDVLGPKWSPDGDQLAYSKGPGVQQQVFRINADGTVKPSSRLSPGGPW